MRGTVIAQAIGFAALPLLSRLFSPAAFGNYQLFLSIVTLLMVFTTLRYEVALLRAHDGRELRALAQLCVFICCAVTGLMTVALYAMAAVGWPRQIAALPFPIALLVLAVFFGGLAQYLTVLVTRQKAFSTGANSKMIQGVSYAGTGVSIGWLKPVSSGLVIADVVGRVANSIWLLFWTRKNLPWLWRPARAVDLIAVARRYREYPYISVPGTVINVLGGIATPVLIYAEFSANESGQYGLLERGVSLPIALIILAVAQVFTAQFSADLRHNPALAMDRFKRTLILMGSLATGLALALLIVAPVAFLIAFGRDWSIAGRLAQIMAPAFASMLLSGPLNMVLTVMGHQKLQTAWEVFRLSLVVLLWTLVPTLNWTLDTAMLGYSAVITIANVGFVALAYIMLRRRVVGNSFGDRGVAL